jgi:hypothetical protein
MFAPCPLFVQISHLLLFSSQMSNQHHLSAQPTFVTTIEAGIRNCMKLSPTIRLGIKVDDCDYQTIKYLVLTYRHGYKKIQNTHLLYVIRVLNFWKLSNNHLKTIRSLPVLSWNLGGSLKGFEIPRTGGSLNLNFFKYQDPAILWFWKFSNTWNQWFFGCQFFFKYPRVADVTKCRYPPQAEVNVTCEWIDTWSRLAYVFHHRW